MPRITTDADLPQAIKDQVARDVKAQTVRAEELPKDAATLTLIQRVTRIERLMDIDTPRRGVSG